MLGRVGKLEGVDWTPGWSPRLEPSPGGLQKRVDPNCEPRAESRGSVGAGDAGPWKGRTCAGSEVDGVGALGGGGGEPHQGRGGALVAEGSHATVAVLAAEGLGGGGGVLRAVAGFGLQLAVGGHVQADCGGAVWKMGAGLLQGVE